MSDTVAEAPTSRGRGPKYLLATCYAVGGLVGAVVLALLVLLAVDGHPLPLLAAAVGAVLPLPLRSIAYLLGVPRSPTIRVSTTGSEADAAEDSRRHLLEDMRLEERLAAVVEEMIAQSRDMTTSNVRLTNSLDQLAYQLDSLQARDDRFAALEAAIASNSRVAASSIGELAAILDQLGAFLGEQRRRDGELVPIMRDMASDRRSPHRISSAGARRCKRGPSLRCPDPEALQFAVQPVCSRRATADRQGAQHGYTRSRA